VASGDELRALMRRFAAGVAVVTVRVEEQRLGITVGSLVSVSLEPPLVSISIGRHSPLLEPLREAGRFSVSVLSGEQAALAQRFARSTPPIALWAGVATREAAGGEPLLEDALGWLECEVRADFDAGDHTIFVGEVLVAEPGAGGPGLAYREGGYHPVPPL
jgi:flavin reductase (DIM6/NTAB) family NADH-FMN oxidoreductase RutF